MENILQTDKTYMFLQPDAAKRLSAARNFADQCGFCRYNILHIDRYLYCILPWIGNVDFFILKKIIILFLADTFDLKDFGGWSPYYLSFKGKEVDVKNFHEALLRILSMLAANKKILSEMLSDDDVIEMKKEFEYKTPKFDNFIPPVLLRKSLMEDYFNIDYLLSKVRMWNLPIVQ
jgi:ATP-dependent Lhr-like helicase